MSDQTRASVELNCPGCGAFFRLKSQKGKTPKGPIPCPKCNTSIPLPEPQATVPKSKVMGLGIIKRRKTPPKSAQQPSLKIDKQRAPSREREDTVKTEQLRDPDSEWDALDISATGAIGSSRTSSTYLGLPAQGFEAEPEKTVVTHQPSLSMKDTPPEEDPKQTAVQDAKHEEVEFSREPTVADNQAILEKLRQVRSTRDLPPVTPEDLEALAGGQGAERARITAELESVEGVRQTPMSMDKLDKLFEGEDLDTLARVKPQDVSWQETDSPFDLKDILDAEKTLGNNISGDITRNPTLDGSMHIRPSPPSIPEVNETFGSSAKRPRSGQVSRLTLDLTEHSVASDNDRSSSGAFQHARVSTGDIFSEISMPVQEPLPASSPPPLPEADSSEILSSASEVDESTDGMSAPKTPSSGTKSPSPKAPALGNLAERLKKKVGPTGLHKLRDQLEHDSEAKDTQQLSTPDLSVETLEIENIDDLIATAIEDSEASEPFKLPELGQAPSVPMPEVSDASAKSTLWGRPNSTPALPASLPEPRKEQSELSSLAPPELFPQSLSLEEAIEAPSSSEEIHDGDRSGIPLISGFPQANQSADDLKIIRSKSRRADDSHSGLIKPLAQTLHEESSTILGAAGERRGSGYIRLPTTEILDVLGKGRYRIMVEDIVYEPVDEQALTQLIKQGVLMGAAMIADEHSDWKPVAEHPVFRRLRKKMAIEAHAVLSKYKREEATASDLSALDTPAALDEHSAATRENIPVHIDEVSESEASEPQESLEPLLAQDSDETLGELIGLSQEVSDTNEPDTKEPAQQDTSEQISSHTEAPVEQIVPQPMPTQEPASVKPSWSDEDALRTPAPSRWKIPVALVIIAGVVAAGLFAANRSQRKPAQPPPPVVPAVALKQDATPDAQGAKNSETKVVEAAPPKQEAPSVSRAKLLFEQKEHASALKMLQALKVSESEDLEARMLLAQVLSATDDHLQARRVAVKAITQVEDSTKRAAWQALYTKSIKEDPALVDRSARELDASFVKRVVAATTKGAHRSWTLETSQGPYIFTTSKPEARGSWRSEVASWRLCQMMLCPFVIPKTVPARVLKDDLEAWLKASPLTDKQAQVQRLTGALVDQRVEGPQGNARTYVYGSLQRHDKDVAPFPIEFKALWAAMVNVREDAGILERPLKAVLSPLEKYDSGRFAEAIKAQAEGLDTTTFVSQLSTMLVFDYLINHRPRFQRKRDNYGTSTGLHQGALYTTGHEDSWGLRASNTIRGRFRYVSRFSKQSITALELLDPALADSILFPSPSATEEKRLKVFWSQRDRALKRIQTVKDGYTPARVMSLP